MNLELYGKQAQVVLSKAHKIGFIAGRGAGKSMASAGRMFKASLEQPDLYGLYAPTFSILRDTTLKTFLEIARPKIRTYNESRGIIRMWSGAEILCRSLDNPEHARGPNLRGCCIDEGGLVHKDAYLILRGGLRAHGELGWMCVTTTPAGKAHWTYDVFGPDRDSDTDLIHACSDENPYNPQDYAPGLRREYTTAYAAQEIDGQFIDLSGSTFERAWFNTFLPEAPAEQTFDRICRFWDMAATEKKQGTDPDWTVGAKVGGRDGYWTILDIRRVQASALSIERLIAQTATLDGDNVVIRMEEEGGASGKSLVSHYARNILPGQDFRGRKPSGDKIARAMPLAAAAEAGNVALVKASWNKDLLDELERFPNGDHDDQVDAIAGAIAELKRSTSSAAGAM